MRESDNCLRTFETHFTLVTAESLLLTFLRARADPLKDMYNVTTKCKILLEGSNNRETETEACVPSSLRSVTDYHFIDAG